MWGAAEGLARRLEQESFELHVRVGPETADDTDDALPDGPIAHESVSLVLTCPANRRTSDPSSTAVADGHLLTVDDDGHGALAAAYGKHGLHVVGAGFDVDVLDAPFRVGLTGRGGVGSAGLTVDLDFVGHVPILARRHLTREELRRLQETEKKSLGELVSELIAEALANRSRSRLAKPPEFHWITKEMGARIDLSDKEAVYAALEEETDDVIHR